MTRSIEPDTEAAIRATVDDYYEGWFDADAERMRRALHPSLVKRALDEGEISTLTAADMIEATEKGSGTRHGPDRRGYTAVINHVHDPIADVHVTGDVYVDYLQMIHVDGRWQIVNALWGFADTSTT